MELVLLLFGSLMMLFLFRRLQKKRVTWVKSLNKAAIILGCLIGVYTITFFSLNAKYQILTPYTDVEALAESGTINLNTLMGIESSLQYSKTFTMLSMIVSVVFFIGLWFMLEKSSDKTEHK